MNPQIQLTADGADVREIGGEISGTLPEREEQLRALFRLAEAAALDRSLRVDHPPRPSTPRGSAPRG